ncbi:MAG: DNA cytosine methyltransferase, partial [Saprospiraceae bacterium]
PHNQRGADFPPLSPEEQEGGALYYIISKLEKAGYAISFNLYNAANFGTPQKRERVVIICSRDGRKAPYLIPTHAEHGEFGLPEWRTFKEAVKNLKNIQHHYIKFPEKRLKYYRQLKAGQNWRSLPLETQQEALGASFFAGGGKTGFLRRLAWDEPAPTLVTHPAMPATDLAHPAEDRPLSVEEYKKIQEFPDEWKIEGSLLEQYKQIGNAVPSSLGKAIGTLILKLIKGESIPQIPDFKYSRYRLTDDVSWKNDFLNKIKRKVLQLELYETS